jgi:hypothetical protein
MNEIALLGDSDDTFIMDVCNTLKSKGYPVVFLRFGEEKMPIDYEFKVIVDRASYADPFLRTMVKTHSLKGTYVLNNPFSNTCDDKITEYTICQKLGIPYPKTVVLPKTNPEMDISEQENPPNLDSIFSQMRFPIVLKPHDGFAWDYVSVCYSPEDAKRIYESEKNRMVLIAQEFIVPKTFYRVYYFSNRDPVFVRYIPSERRYIVSDYSDIQKTKDKIRDYTIRLNLALNYDFNACEWAVDANDNIYLIDGFNETPEIDRSVIPAEYYGILVERFASMVEEKYKSNELNKWPFNFTP